MPTRRGVWMYVLSVTVVGAGVLFAALRLHVPASPASPNTVLVFDVPAELEEGETPFSLQSLDLVRWKRSTLHRVVDGLRRATADDRVVALVLHIDELDWGWARLAEIRDALLAFRNSGKPVYASLVSGGDAEYFLASAAGWIAMPPTSILELDGLTESVLFYKGTFDKLDIRPNFAHAGRFKSAVESYTRSGMSPESRENLSRLLDDQFRLLVDTLSSARGTPPDAMRDLIDLGPFAAAQAFDQGLVDTLIYDSEVDSLALEDAGARAEVMPFSQYVERLPSSHGGRRIALIAASGTIVAGRSRFSPTEGHTLGSESLIEALAEARTRRSIKAVVLRIDSPGGEMTAADDIWREVARCSEVKPVIASMSDVAASGGYYIAVAADRIVAEPGTVTGSIGIYGGKLNLLGLYRKLGLNVETLSRGRHAEMMSSFKDFTDDEARRYAQQLEDSYQQFLERVADGRGISTAAVDSLGQGRVWSGLGAYEEGLVDTLGGIETAFEMALKEAGLSARQGFVVEPLPKVEHPLIERLLEEWVGEDASQIRAKALPSAIRSWLVAARVPVGAALALMPYSIEIR